MGWRRQLNVQKVMDKKRMISLRALLIDGNQFNTVFNTAEPRRYLLTNAFSF